MKKLLFLMAMILPMALCFTSCSDDDDEVVLEEIDKNLFVGEWEVSDRQDSPWQKGVIFDISSSSIEIDSYYDYDYTIDGNKVVLRKQWGGQRAAEIEVLSLTETRMKIKVKDLVEGFGTYKLTLKKID